MNYCQLINKLCGTPGCFSALNSAVKNLSVKIINNPHHLRSIVFGSKLMKKQARFTNGLRRVHAIHIYSTNYKSRKPFVNFYKTAVH